MMRGKKIYSDFERIRAIHWRWEDTQRPGRSWQSAHRPRILESLAKGPVEGQAHPAGQEEGRPCQDRRGHL